MVFLRGDESRWRPYRPPARNRLLGWVFGIAVLVLVAALFLISQYTHWIATPNICRKGEYGPPDNCANYNLVIFAFLSVFYFIDDHSGAFVAFFTFVLWYSTDKLWKLGRSEFLATHRPILRVRSIMFDGFPMGGEPGVCFVYVVNVGTSAALNIKFDARFVYTVQRQTSAGMRGNGVTPGNELITPMIHKRGESLEIGERAHFAPSRPYGRENAGGLTMMTADIVSELVGRIEYEDSAGTRRETGFTWRYDYEAGAFLRPSTEDEFNYED